MRVRRDLDNKDDYRYMVHWFSPMVLVKTLEKVLPSTLFARYADRRLVHAALDSPLNEDTLVEKCCGGEKGVCGANDKPEIWVDYVADLGDGFDSTYAIAYSIGKKELELADGTKLPRADCLVMGGDEVYPDASREDYEARMERPYRLAFPTTNKAGAAHPPIYLIPGNHDWYDGLALFLAKFCNGDEDNHLGSWSARQRRSYFAVHLAHNWWIWGFDSQLDEDIDRPQADYFRAVARKMPPDAKVIICASVPTWLVGSMAGPDSAKSDRFYRGLEFVAEIINKHCPGAKVPLVLSGDLHHYSRYKMKELGTNFITAGGGGAFLHPTHFLLNDKIEKVFWGRPEQALEIGNDKSNANKKSIYPQPDQSRRLALGNLWFWYKNPDFCLLLGLLYFICALLMFPFSGRGEAGGLYSLPYRFSDLLVRLATTPTFVLLAVALFVVLLYAADIRSASAFDSKALESKEGKSPRWHQRLRAFLASRKFRAVGLHWFAHIATILIGIALTSTLIVGLRSIYLAGELLYALIFAIGMAIAGFIGGFFWGLYLTIASYRWGDEPNNAFSAMRLDGYKNFIRMKIEKDRLTIFPIGIDKVPPRSGWKVNDAFDEKNPDQDIPAVIPVAEIGQHLIEAPIVLDIDQITPLRAGQ